MENLGPKYHAHVGDYSVPQQDVIKWPYRLLYSNRVPVGPEGWTIFAALDFETIAKVARDLAKHDLLPDSGVSDNLFFIQRWTGEEWDENDESGENDLADLAFETEGDG